MQMGAIMDTRAAPFETAMRLWGAGHASEAEAMADRAITEAEACGAGIEVLVRMHDDWAGWRFGQGAFDEVTRRHYQSAHDMLAAEHGARHPDVANLLNNLSALASARGQSAEAEAHARRALAIVRTLEGQVARRELAFDEETERAVRLIHLTAMRHVATALRLDGRYVEATVASCEALHFAHRHWPANDPQVAVCDIQLGIVHKYAGRYDEAGHCYQGAWQVLAQSAQASQDQADLLYNLGALAHARGCWDEAQAYLQRALDLDARLHGAGHPSPAIKQGALALTLMEQGRLEEAEALSRVVLQRLTEALGEGHPDVAVPLGQRAAILAALGRLPEAEELARRACAVREAALGAGHPLLALSLNTLAGILRRQGRFAEAIGCQHRAGRVLEEHGAPPGGGGASRCTPTAALALLAGVQRGGGDSWPLAREAVRDAAGRAGR